MYRKKTSDEKTQVKYITLYYSLLQMANLAHRASQFLNKKFLIVHPTADGMMTTFHPSIKYLKKL